MTDSALSAAPQSEVSAAHLSREQLDELRELIGTRLLAERGRTDRALEAVKDFSASYSHEDRELAQLVLQRGAEHVSLLERALERMDNGHYGFCVGCERPIAVDWLSVMPEVRHCVGCMRIG